MNRKEVIERLYDAHAEYTRADKRLKDLSKPVLNTTESVERIFKECVSYLGADPTALTTFQRRIILYVILSFTCPIALVGKRMKKGLRKVIGDIMYKGISQCVASADVSRISFYYQCYKDFESTVDTLTARIEKLNNVKQ